MITNNEEHECKDCKEKLPTFMTLLKQVAEHHSKEQVEVERVNVPTIQSDLPSGNIVVVW